MFLGQAHEIASDQGASCFTQSLWRLVVGDIKPDNIILTLTGVKIFDLGLARSALDTSDILSHQPEERWAARKAAIALQELAKKLPGPTMSEFVQSAPYHAIVREQYAGHSRETKYRTVQKPMRFLQHRVMP